MNATKPYIKVVVGVILNEQTGEILLGQRPKGKPWEDWWEFPGGKIEDGESQKQALVRELKEELGIDVHACTPWVTFTYEYPKTIVNLAFWRVTGWEARPDRWKSSNWPGRHPQMRASWASCCRPPCPAALAGPAGTLCHFEYSNA